MQANAAIPAMIPPKAMLVQLIVVPEEIRSMVFRKLAPAIAGIAIRNDMREAASLVNPRSSAIVIVTPEREAPGIRAIHWLMPINNAEGRSRSC